MKSPRCRGYLFIESLSGISSRKKGKNPIEIIANFLLMRRRTIKQQFSTNKSYDIVEHRSWVQSRTVALIESNIDVVSSNIWWFFSVVSQLILPYFCLFSSSSQVIEDYEVIDVGENSNESVSDVDGMTNSTWNLQFLRTAHKHLGRWGGFLLNIYFWKEIPFKRSFLLNHFSIRNRFSSTYKCVPWVFWYY